jgi:hypothetical protein
MGEHALTVHRSGENWLHWGFLSLLVFALLGILMFLPIQSYVQSLLEWTRGIGYWGYLVVIGF